MQFSLLLLSHFCSIIFSLACWNAAQQKSKSTLRAGLAGIDYINMPFLLQLDGVGGVFLEFEVLNLVVVVMCRLLFRNVVIHDFLRGSVRNQYVGILFLIPSHHQYTSPKNECVSIHTRKTNKEH